MQNCFRLINQCYCVVHETFYLCRVLRLQPGHKFCLLGRLSEEVGWHHYDTIKVCSSLPVTFINCISLFREISTEVVQQLNLCDVPLGLTFQFYI